MTKKEEETQALSEDWVELVKIAMDSKVTKEEFKQFLEESSNKNKD